MFRKLLLVLLFLCMPLQANAAQGTAFNVHVWTGNVAFGAGGIETQYLVGSFVKNAVLNGTTLTLTVKNADDTETDIAFTGGTGGDADGVLSAASFDTTTQILTLTLSTGVTVTVDVSDLTSIDEVTTAINAAVPSGNALVPTTDGVPGDVLTRTATSREWSAPVGDGRVISGEVTGTTLTLRRSDSLAPVTITGLPQAGEATNDGVVTDLTVALNVLTATRSESLAALVVTLPTEVVVPDENGILRDATENDLNTIAIDHGNIRVGTPHTTTHSVTLSNYSATGFRGVVSFPTTILDPNDGDRTFGYGVRLWYRYSTDHWTTVGAAPTGWRGSYQNRAAAERVINAVGQIVWWTGAANMKQASAYTHGGVVYAWEPEQERQEILTRPVLPDPTPETAGQYAKINTAGNEYEVAPLEIPEVVEEIVHVPADDVSFVSSDVNLIEFTNVPTATDGIIYQFFSEGVNTGEVRIRISGTDYVVFKSAEFGAFEVLSGGELENTQPVQLTYYEASFYWTGTLLGNAAGKDIGLFEGEIPVIESYGHLATSAIATEGTNYQILTRIPGVPGHGWRDDRSVAPVDSPSFPQIAPAFTGQLAANSTGHLYVAVEERVSHLNDPTWNTALLSTVIPAPPNETFILYRGVTDQDLQFGTVPAHSFWFDPTFHYWQLRSNPNVGLTWPQIVDYFRANPSSTDTAPTDFLPLTGHKSYFLQGPETAFTSDLEAAKYAVVHGVNDRTARSYVFFVGTPSNSDTWVLRLAQRTAYIEGTHSVLVERHWDGPVQDGSVINGSVDDVTGIMTLGRSEGDPIVVENVHDGVVRAGAYGSGVLTLQRSVGLPDVAIGGFPNIPTPGQSLGSATLQYTGTGNIVSWERGAYRGAWDSTILYQPGDRVTHGGNYWRAVNAVLNVTPDNHQSTRWQRLTSNVDYLGDLVTIPYEYQNGHIVHQGGHYYLRVGGAGNLAPNAAPGEWVQLDGHAQTDSACGVRSHFEQGVANILATVTTGTATSPTDPPMFTIQYAPQSINSRVYISMYANLEALDDADTEEETRYIYSLYHGPGSGETFGVAKGVLRHTSGDGISEYDHTLSIQFVHQPATMDDTTYSFRLQRRQTGTEPPMEVRVAAYSIHVLDLGDPNASCDVRLETIPVKKDNVDVVVAPTALDFTSFLGVTDDTGIARITPRFDNLDLISSTDLLDTDLLVAQDISDNNAMKKLTVGSLADELSDGTTTTSGGGLISVPFDNFLPNDLNFALVGSVLTGTITMPAGADLVDSVTLPAGGGGDPFDTASAFAGDPADPDRILIRDVSASSTEYLTFLQFKGDVSPTLRDEGITQGGSFDILNFVGAGVTCAQSGTLGTCTIPDTPLDIAGLPNQSSTDLADVDMMVISNVSDSNANRHLTMGSLGNFLADGISIESNEGVLSALGSAADVVNSLDTSISDRDLTITLGREALTDLASTVAIPGPFDGAVNTTILNTDDMFVMYDPGLDRTEAITGIDLSRAFRLERGPFENTRNYDQGDIVETGAGDDVTFWIASVDISSGGGAPTYASSGLWWLVASHGFWREEIDPTLTYNFHDGDSYHLGDEVFLVTEDVTGVTGDALRSGEHILEISNFPISDEGTQVSDNTESLNFTGTAITCTGDRNVVCDVTGGSGGITGIRIEEGGNVRVASANALDFNINDFAINIVQDPEAGVSIAAALTRDSEVADAFEAVSVAGNQLTFTQIDGGTSDVTISSFDLHRDVPTQFTIISDSDRFVFSDENMTGDPMRYISSLDLFNSLRDIVDSNITTTLQTDDRMYITDENVSGDPMRYVELGDLQTFFGSGVVANPGTANTDYLDDITIGTTDFEIRGDPTQGRAPITVSEILNIENRMFMTEFLNATHTPKFVSMGTFRRNVITHQGGYDGTRAYQLGAVVFTGLGEDLTYWITSAYVPAGEDAPNFSEPGPWYHLGHRATYFGDFGDQDAVVDFYQGSSFLYQDEFYFVTGNNLDTSIFDLIAGTDVIQITDPFRHRDASTAPPGEDDLILFDDISENESKTRTWQQIKNDVKVGLMPIPNVGDLMGTYTAENCSSTGFVDSAVDFPTGEDWIYVEARIIFGYYGSLLVSRQVLANTPSRPDTGDGPDFGSNDYNSISIPMGQNRGLKLGLSTDGSLLLAPSHTGGCEVSFYSVQ